MHYTDNLDSQTVQILAGSMMGRGRINYRYYETMPRGREHDLEYRKYRDWKWGFWNGLPWAEIKADFYADQRKCLIPEWIDEKMSYQGINYWMTDCFYNNSLYVGNWRPGHIQRFIDRFNKRTDSGLYLNPAGRLVIPMSDRFDDAKRWSATEVAILIENSSLSATELHKLLPRHSLKSIYCKRARL